MPISYSEASWTGMFNYTTCTREEEIVHLVPLECRQALPIVLDSFHWEDFHYKQQPLGFRDITHTIQSLYSWPEFAIL